MAKPVLSESTSSHATPFVLQRLSALLEIIDNVYSCADRSTMFLATFEKLEKWIGISSAVYLSLDVERGAFHVTGSVNYHIDEAAFRSFFTPPCSCPSAGARETAFDDR